MIERSHGKLYALRKRSRDLPAGPADAVRVRDRDDKGRFRPGNEAGRNRSANRSLTATLRRLAHAGATQVAGDTDGPPASAEIAQQAMLLFRAGKRDVGSDSAIALSHLVRWAVSTAISQHLVGAAADAGLGSDRGLRLLERAERHSQQAERSSIAALDCARALSRPAVADPGADLERRAQELLAQQRGKTE